jgi:hypothetical protein
VLVYQKSKDMITVLPRLRAAGRDDIEFGGKSYSAAETHIVDHDVTTTQFSRDVADIFKKKEQSFYPSTLGEMNLDKQYELTINHSQFRLSITCLNEQYFYVHFQLRLLRCS